MEQRGGSIINIASVNGPGGWPRRTAYGPSKASIIALTKELACEWGNAGIRVNAVGPAYITTPMVEGLIKEDKIDVERLCNRTPLNRLGGPEEVARAIVFLASDWASYITGETLFVEVSAKKKNNLEKLKESIILKSEISVSYTHLTLPTNREV